MVTLKLQDLDYKIALRMNEGLPPIVSTELGDYIHADPVNNFQASNCTAAKLSLSIST